MQYNLLILIYKISIDKWNHFRIILLFYPSLFAMIYKKELEAYVAVEQEAHIYNSSSIVNKVTQEVLELKQGKRKNDLANVEEEIRDAIVNILSANHKTGVLPSEWVLMRNMPVTWDDVDDSLSDWNEDIQWINQDYSRRHVSPEQLKASTEKLISTILSFGNSQETLAQILAHNTEKFRARIPKYRPNIDLKDYITNHPDFPKKDIQFKNIFPIFRIPEIKRFLKNEIRRLTEGTEHDIVALCSSRWYLFDRDDVDMIPVAKKWKLPWDTISESYEKEYWIDEIEIFNNIKPGQRVVIIDDLLATWWTVDAAAKAIERAWWVVAKIIVVIRLNDDYCKGKREEYNVDRYPIETLVEYDN